VSEKHEARSSPPAVTKRRNRQWHGLREFLTSNNILVLLVFVPLSIISGSMGANPNLVFVFSMLAILPLASELSSQQYIVAEVSISWE
jgi:Ca2+/H+ antiporter